MGQCIACERFNNGNCLKWRSTWHYARELYPGENQFEKRLEIMAEQFAICHGDGFKKAGKN